MFNMKIHWFQTKAGKHNTEKPIFFFKIFESPGFFLHIFTSRSFHFPFFIKSHT